MGLFQLIQSKAIAITGPIERKWSLAIQRVTERYEGLRRSKAGGMQTSMRLAEHESKRDNEELIAEVVVDVHDPAAPIFETARLSEGLHDTGRVIARLSEVVDHSAAAID
jgi:hypothetical protein